MMLLFLFFLVAALIFWIAWYGTRNWLVPRIHRNLGIALLLILFVYLAMAMLRGNYGTL